MDALLWFGGVVLALLLARASGWRDGLPWLLAFVGLAGAFGMGYTSARPGFHLGYLVGFTAMAAGGLLFLGWAYLCIEELRKRVDELEREYDQREAKHPSAAAFDVADE
jgi:hypothetical protein